MTIRLYKVYTKNTCNCFFSRFEEIVKSNPEKKLTYEKIIKRVISSQHRGGGHKRLYQQIDFR
jgi:large subunit ribosomal protein L2